MKTCIKNVLSLFSVLAFLTAAQPVAAAAAPDLGWMLGLKSADYDMDGVSTNAQPGIMLGVISIIEFGGLDLRTGGYYAERKTEVEAGGEKADFSISYVDVPVTALFKFNDNFGVFAGALLALKVADDCDLDNVSCDPESLHFAATGGLRAGLGPNWAGELFYEMGLNEVADETDVNSISLNVQFIY